MTVMDPREYLPKKRAAHRISYREFFPFIGGPPFQAAVIPYVVERISRMIQRKKTISCLCLMVAYTSVVAVCRLRDADERKQPRTNGCTYDAYNIHCRRILLVNHHF